jgi:VanZ family protein
MLRDSFTRHPVFLWASVAVWAAIIFFFSAQPSLSTNLGVWDFILRKMAHMTEYAILFLLLWRALRLHIHAERVAMIAAASAALIYAASDEWHQTFVRGRSGTIRDIGFDLAGILGAWLFAAWLSRRRSAGRA